jgi:hypothetical protein
MLSSKKLTFKETLRQVFICLMSRTLYPPPLHTVYEYTVFLFTQEWGDGGGGEGEFELNQREG